jgi:hypothetical protein
MSDLDPDFPEQDENEPAAELDRDDDGQLSCPECGKPFTSPMQLGAHRSQAHGVKGGSRAAAKRRGELPPEEERRGPGRPRKDGSPARPRHGGGSRQERRRKAVQDTLIELVSFTDEARGRDTGPPVDLADVIRRDAAKIANSVAWLAERFNPLGRVIDLGFGHGGVITIARGFLGVGTWTLGHWRQLLEQRSAVDPTELTAEQVAEQMQAEHGAERTYA